MINQELNHKRILVTGATSGIGRQIAITCISNGAEVVFSGKSIEKLQELKKNFGDKHSYINADLSLDNDINYLVDACEPLDGLVHCVGIMKTLPAKFIHRSVLEEVMNINFFSSVLLTSALLKRKKIKKEASIVFISSIGGNYIASKGNSMYSASKGAMNAYAKVLALELAAASVRVNTINPGMVKTEMWTMDISSISEDQILEDQKKYPLGYGEPCDVAEAALFLLSSKAKWITGSELVLDGGFTLQ